MLVDMAQIVRGSGLLELVNLSQIRLSCLFSKMDSWNNIFDNSIRNGIFPISTDYIYQPKCPRLVLSMCI